MKLLLLCLILFTCPAHSLETDNYLSWTVDLEDSRLEINQLIKNEIQEALRESYGKNLSCREITFQIAERFRSGPQHTIFEEWSVASLSEDKIYPQTHYYMDQSIYRSSARFYMRYIGLSPNLQINGIYLGIDKLSHFGSTGRRYLKRYLQALDRGELEESAQRDAIEFGVQNERSVLGLWASGVLGYGDIEANFQGFTFYRKLCLKKGDNYLLQQNGEWRLIRNPDIGEYVSPFWDETFYAPYYTRRMWKSISESLKNYCKLAYSERILKRFDYYRRNSSSKSASWYYIENMKNSGQLPYPQSFKSLCN